MALKTNFNYSPNFSSTKRNPKQIKFLIIHYTGMKKESDALKRLTKIQSEVSSHYFIKNNGNMDFNIAIRTMLYKNGKLKYPVGGGIVWDSKIENEWEETKTKAKILYSITK